MFREVLRDKKRDLPFFQEMSIAKNDDFKSLFEDFLCEIAFITDLTNHLV